MEIKKFTPTTHYIKALIYGSSGAGKTTFAGTAKDVIFASAENGLLSIADKAPDFAEIKSLADLRSLYSFLKGKHDYKTVVVDSITEINDIIKREIELRSGKGMQLQDWGKLSRDIKNIFVELRNLPMNVLFLAQETIDKDEEKINKILPSLNGKSATEIAYFMDIVGYIYLDKTGERKIKTTSDARLLTKDRSNVIGDNLPLDFEVWIERIKNIKTSEIKTVKEISDKKEFVFNEKTKKAIEIYKKDGKTLPAILESIKKEHYISDEDETAVGSYFISLAS